MTDTKPADDLDQQARDSADLFEIIRTFIHRNNVPPVKETGGYAALDAVREIEKRMNGIWQPISTAPKDGTSILLKFKDDLSAYYGSFEERMKGWEGLCFVGRAYREERHHIMGWGFAAPVGNGGFPDAWIEGWMPLPGAKT